MEVRNNCGFQCAPLLSMVKVTTDADRWEIGNAETAMHDHVGSYGDAVH